MYHRRRRQPRVFGVERLGPLIVPLIALAVRLWGIDWQLPAALYYDETKLARESPW